eukprot:TRINITY_DN7298_c0_g1_i2.p1 TRINITY_DN7298_c0_g1~~TRINITY_DN7298_c0_g1_i2.p1  ORF type:complete len:169 (+),score=47.98 TRINITY_DN7298_c0_g1_i2:84-590(+)
MSGQELVEIGINGSVDDLINFRLQNKVISINSKGNQKQDTILHKASFNGNLGIVKYIIENIEDVDIRQKNKWEAEPLHYSCRNGHLDITKVLLDSNADINCGNDNLFRPLHLASKYGQLETVKFLLNNNVNKELKNKKGETAYDVILDGVEDKEEEKMNELKDLLILE